MMDKRTRKFITVLFFMLGVTTLMLVWGRPMPQPERIMTTVIGATCLLGVLVQASAMVYMVVHNSRRKNPARIQARRSIYQ